MSETTKDITLPTLTISILGCYTTTWTVHLKSDNSDMTVSKPGVFAIADPNLALTHSVSDLAQRKSLFGSSTYYFIGSTSTTPTATISSQFEFTIDFQDVCQSSTITSKTFSLTDVKLDTSQTQTEAAFLDSVDASSTYS